MTTTAAATEALFDGRCWAVTPSLRLSLVDKVVGERRLSEGSLAFGKHDHDGRGY